MAEQETRRVRLRRLIAGASASNDQLEIALAAIADELDAVYARIDQLESELVSMAGTLPWTDGSEGRSDESLA
jgi:septal ring factor EnvC (AmiA/AmiB activator)